MKTQLLTGLVIAAATVTGAFSNAASAHAFTWNNSWTQPTISGKAETGFDDVPYQKYVQKESVEIPGSGQYKIDPSQLFLKYDHNVTVSFINEGAGYRNQLAFESTGATATSGLLFNDISCAGAGCVGAWGGNALKLGDTVSAGAIKGGSQLDFFLRADGLNRGNNANIFGTQTSMNADGLQHVVAYAVGERYLLLGFEDLYGAKGATGGKNENSDRDFNDTVFVVDIGEKNFKHLTGQKVPEPSVTLSLLGLGAAGVVVRRRRQNKATD
ncbi:DUF4114 domain-containing protein [Myxacorys almedinensis]|uniref:DUF4114 domain-containing protein n=1 Tax=Myxacorys almedinensis A TaxID=2690445 RepID=A0A8J8CMP1_9CYAN|nr:DUF4114 domain-containing protein [Myxacorys almedinensis]NDJ17507.1 DUF4114 domain-containing protein [Myxacorys almedinensis A]